MRTLIPTVVIFSLIPFSLFASARSNSGGLPERVAELEAQVEVLAAALEEAQEILQYVRVKTEVINDLEGPHLIFEGVNVHVWSGIGSTDGATCPSDQTDCSSGNSLGNLIVGYNELPRSGRSIRYGMHNLVVGHEHEFFSFGGFVAGRHNSIGGRGASVTGGRDNQARGAHSSVSGGVENLAYGSAASVSGGFGNLARGSKSSVSGGEEREALGEFNWVAGGLFEPN
jgi:hypothetical protein